MITRKENGTAGPAQPPPDFPQQLKRLTLELKEVERLLIHAHLPREPLEALSEAVDRLRMTNWAVLNSTVDQFSSTEGATIVLTSHRIQRALALLNDLEGEIDFGRITPATDLADQLCTRLGVVYKKFHYTVRRRTAPPDGL